jgi:hypothetical protein
VRAAVGAVSVRDRVEVRGELWQQAGVLGELEPEPAAQPR